MPLVGQPFYKNNSNPEENTFHWPFIDSELPTEIAICEQPISRK